MRIYGVVIEPEQIEHCVGRMQGTFTITDIEQVAIAAGVPKSLKRKGWCNTDPARELARKLILSRARKGQLRKGRGNHETFAVVNQNSRGANKKTDPSAVVVPNGEDRTRIEWPMLDPHILQFPITVMRYDTRICRSFRFHNILTLGDLYAHKKELFKLRHFGECSYLLVMEELLALANHTDLFPEAVDAIPPHDFVMALDDCWERIPEESRSLLLGNFAGKSAPATAAQNHSKPAIVRNEMRKAKLFLWDWTLRVRLWRNYFQNAKNCPLRLPDLYGWTGYEPKHELSFYRKALSVGWCNPG